MKKLIISPWRQYRTIRRQGKRYSVEIVISSAIREVSGLADLLVSRLRDRHLAPGVTILVPPVCMKLFSGDPPAHVVFREDLPRNPILVLISIPPGCSDWGRILRKACLRLYDDPWRDFMISGNFRNAYARSVLEGLM